MSESEKVKSKKENLFGNEDNDYLEDDYYFQINDKNTFSVGDSV